MSCLLPQAQPLPVIPLPGQLGCNSARNLGVASPGRHRRGCFVKGSILIWRYQRPQGFPGGSAGKEPTCNVGDLGSIPGLGRSPGEGKGCPLQDSGLENSMGCRVHGVTKSWTPLSDSHFTGRSDRKAALSQAAFAALLLTPTSKQPPSYAYFGKVNVNDSRLFS